MVSKVVKVDVPSKLRLVHNILYASRRDRKSLFFQWAWTQRDAGVELDSILHRVASEPIEKIMTSSWDATRWNAKDIVNQP